MLCQLVSFIYITDSNNCHKEMITRSDCCHRNVLDAFCHGGKTYDYVLSRIARSEVLILSMYSFFFFVRVLHSIPFVRVLHSIPIVFHC